jgi:hypothetical protein
VPAEAPRRRWRAAAGATPPRRCTAGAATRGGSSCPRRAGWRRCRCSSRTGRSSCPRGSAPHWQILMSHGGGELRVLMLQRRHLLRHQAPHRLLQLCSRTASPHRVHFPAHPAVQQRARTPTLHCSRVRGSQGSWEAVVLPAWDGSKSGLDGGKSGDFGPLTGVF